MASLVPNPLPTVNHPDFVPGPPTNYPYRPPPPDVLADLEGDRPYKPADLATLKVGDRVALVGMLPNLPDWSTGTIKKMEYATYGQGRGRITYTYFFLDMPIRKGMLKMIDIPTHNYNNGASTWLYKLRRGLTEGEAKGLSEIGTEKGLPHHIVAEIGKAITGKKPATFAPGAPSVAEVQAKFGVATKKAGRKGTRRRTYRARTQKRRRTKKLRTI
jgi:hypothetical protein